MHRLRKIKTLRELGQFYWRTFSPEEMTRTSPLQFQRMGKIQYRNVDWGSVDCLGVKAGIRPCLEDEQATSLSPG